MTPAYHCSRALKTFELHTHAPAQQLVYHLNGNPFAQQLRSHLTLSAEAGARWATLSRPSVKRVILKLPPTIKIPDFNMQDDGNLDGPGDGEIGGQRDENLDGWGDDGHRDEGIHGQMLPAPQHNDWREQPAIDIKELAQ
ncbi:hypothetical protein EDD22DRAFT_965055 [Suillus occidentalis]|nr:hypothetical protein EDD22DRAFT_965055 [Suillus occidentalis]